MSVRVVKGTDLASQTFAKVGLVDLGWDVIFDESDRQWLKDCWDGDFDEVDGTLVIRVLTKGDYILGSSR